LGSDEKVNKVFSLGLSKKTKKVIKNAEPQKGKVEWGKNDPSREAMMLPGKWDSETGGLGKK